MLLDLPPDGNPAVLHKGDPGRESKVVKKPGRVKAAHCLIKNLTQVSAMPHK
jgi:hypothetical protein